MLIFSKIQSKSEAIYLLLAVGVPIGIFSIADQQIWLYLMVFFDILIHVLV
ncbi:hypothetical protein [Peribacillus psychrosaccharolyticus]|uniref:hypothetical protein n=1 Tax=Peribacillus psychrosaccharolyticus TaxID=1407 RepID=UPI000313A948|nr:hypothetical protein [Peribacillus psychrosaccharolyticus]